MFLFTAATVAACYGAVYAVRLFRLRRQVAQNLYLPPENYLSWTAEPQQGHAFAIRAPGDGAVGHAVADRHAIAGRVAQLPDEGENGARLSDLIQKQRLTGLALAGAAIDAVLTNLSNIQHLLDIDWNVIRALDFSFAADLSDFDRLHAIVHEGLNQDPEQIAGWLSRLHGYVAEQIAAEALSAQGHHVGFPDVPNQAGYDLIVDGHPVQVKAGLDPQAIHEHLQAHPDIPVLTSPEMAEHFHDVPGVTGLPEIVRRSEDEALKLQENVKRDLQRKVNQLYTALAGLVQEQAARVHAAWEALRVEAAKLGKDIGPLSQ